MKLFDLWALWDRIKGVLRGPSVPLTGAIGSASFREGKTPLLLVNFFFAWVTPKPLLLVKHTFAWVTPSILVNFFLLGGGSGHRVQKVAKTVSKHSPESRQNCFKTPEIVSKPFRTLRTPGPKGRGRLCRRLFGCEPTDRLQGSRSPKSGKERFGVKKLLFPIDPEKGA